eukprot:1346504-Amorphochlora_amoeboformis.AAC.2
MEINQVSEGEIKRSVTGDMMKKYRKFKRNREIAMDPNRRWCIKPNCEGVLTKTKLKRKSRINTLVTTFLRNADSIYTHMDYRKP